MQSSFKSLTVAIIIGWIGLQIPMLAQANVTQSDVKQLSSAGYQKLSDAKKAEVVAMIEQTTKTEDSTLAKVSKYVDISEQLGKSIVNVAQQLGVAANEFVKTPIGIMVATLIVWAYMGSFLVHVFSAFLVLIFGMVAMRWIHRTYGPHYETKYDHSQKDWLGRSKIVNVTKHKQDGDYGGLMGIAFVVTVVLFFLALLTF